MWNLSSEELLYSSFCVEARLKCSMQQLRKRLASVPSLKLTSHGTRLRYEVIGDGDKRVLELESGAIRFVFYFAKPDDSIFPANLMRLFAVLAMVDDLYDIKLGSVYSYVIDALGKQVPQYGSGGMNRGPVDRLSRNVEGLTFANSKLSHAIYDKSASEKALKEKLQACKGFCAAVIGAISRRGPDINEELEKYFGVEAGLSDRVASIVKGGDE